ncbi:AAA family ATPase [Hydrogenophaga sp. BPS33]|uniref:AAA family ATPase n=1 Tax=Hydrogenophaga sp. BPS33 TaxID=2651974 RepID=UPI00131F9D2D|nr:AAA family ATPase [Hydrogenophaga sp. BPS33]QHE89215.1 AAA family ATPase [Hydrogenophaga sp. BPS33]
MRIARLVKAHGYRIFRDFSWPATGLHDFSRYNVIYGWNGAGKTSLSTIFRHLQRKQPLSDGQVQVLVDQAVVNGADFGTTPLPALRVFNRDTVDRSVFESGGQQLPPVFFLGEDSVEKQKQIEELTIHLNAALEKAVKHRGDEATASTAYESFCSEEAKGIKNLLTVAGGGPYNNYNAANFKADIANLAQTTPAPTKLSEADRKKYLAARNSAIMDPVDAPSIGFPDVVDLTNKTRAALGRSVVSKVVDRLAANPALATWVDSGLAMHIGDNATDACEFCGGPLKPERVQQLEDHFNDEFKRFQSDLSRLIAEVQKAQAFQKTLEIPPKEALYGNLRTAYEEALKSLNSQASMMWSALDVLLRALHAKRDEPFKSMELMPFISGHRPDDAPASGWETLFHGLYTGMAVVGAALGQTAFVRLSELITEHNRQTSSFETTVANARKALARDELLRALPDWKVKAAAVDTATADQKTATDTAKELKRQIAALEQQVRQHRRPAEELNKELASYLGRDELRFDVEQNGYKIMRGDQPALHLSDGERTSIAFLYFLKSLKATDFDLESGIVVIDDPVSSLDANSLFSAFGYMKARTAAAGQLFVLTHNFTFFRQVRLWFDKLPQQNKKDAALHPARFYMLSTEVKGGMRGARLSELDPLLRGYESEYHYLFKRLQEESKKEDAPTLEAYYALPNMARRLLEAFLAFRVPHQTGDLYKQLDTIDHDNAAKTRILRFLHAFSHLDQVADPEHNPSMLVETPSVLRDLFALIEHTDAAHFKSMNDLVASA